MAKNTQDATLFLNGRSKVELTAAAILNGLDKTNRHFRQSDPKPSSFETARGYTRDVDVAVQFMV